MNKRYGHVHRPRSKNKETYVRRVKVVTKNVLFKVRIRLEIGIEIGLDFDQSKQS